MENTFKAIKMIEGNEVEVATSSLSPNQIEKLLAECFCELGLASFNMEAKKEMYDYEGIEYYMPSKYVLSEYLKHKHNIYLKCFDSEGVHYQKEGKNLFSKIGKFIGKHFANICPLRAENLSFITDKFKASIKMYSVKVYGNDAIQFFYNKIRDLNSCMEKDPVSDIYNKFDKFLGIAILYKGINPVGRALVWENTYYDRIYVQESEQQTPFADLLEKGDYECMFRKNFCLEYPCNFRADRDLFYPYLDSLKYLVISGDRAVQLTSSFPGNEASYLYLNGSSGEPQDWNNIDDNGSYYSEGEPTVYSEYYEENIPESIAAWSEYHDSYIYDNDSVYSEYYDSIIVENDAVYSEVMDSYLHRNDDNVTRETIIISNDGTDDYDWFDTSWAMYSDFHGCYIARNCAIWSNICSDYFHHASTKEKEERKQIRKEDVEIIGFRVRELLSFEKARADVDKMRDKVLARKLGRYAYMLEY